MFKKTITGVKESMLKENTILVQHQSFMFNSRCYFALSVQFIVKYLTLLAAMLFQFFLQYLFHCERKESCT